MIGSPHILQTSGLAIPNISGASACRSVRELRGVGKDMQDHYVARVYYPVIGAQTANEFSRDLPLAGEVMRRLFTDKDMLTDSPSIVSHRRIRYAARCQDANFASV